MCVAEVDQAYAGAEMMEKAVTSAAGYSGPKGVGNFCTKF